MGDPVSTRWDCYQWVGPASDDQSFKTARRDVKQVAPPYRLGDWVRKPRSMLALAATDPAKAVGWLRDQVVAMAERIAPTDPGRLPRLLGYLDHRAEAEPALAHHCGFGPCDVLCRITNHDRIVHWQFRVTGSEEAAWAIVPNRSADLTR